jgi:hypothetical protein
MYVNDSRSENSIVSREGSKYILPKEVRGVMYLFCEVIQWPVPYAFKAICRESWHMESIGISGDVTLKPVRGSD